MRRVAIAIFTLLSCTACSEPPQKEIDRAQGAIDAARAAGAEQYATEPFSAAALAMQQTHEAVGQRDYRLALSRAIDANERALEAARQAADGKAKAQSYAEASVARVATVTRQLEERVKMAESARLPGRELESARRARTAAERALQDARTAIAGGNYLAVEKITSGLAERITDEIRALNETIDARSGRGTRRRR